MKRIVALLCVLAGVSLMSSAQPSRVITEAQMLGPRICLLHVYDWQEDDATGAITISQADPYYYGGWTTTVGTGSKPGYLTFVDGFTEYSLPHPFRVNYAAATVTLEASETPFATVTGSTESVVNGTTTRIDSTQYYYVVDEGWIVNGSAMSNVSGTILPDGTIHIPGGFALYIETQRVTTITNKWGEVRTFTDETVTMSKLYRDTWLVRPNGKHEFTTEASGQPRSADVYLRQSGDTVYVTNLYGLGGPESYMLLNAGGTMTYPSQPLCDITAAMSPNGDGMWWNASVNGSALVPGNEGNATAAAITWGLLRPWDHADGWTGWYDNKLYFTNGEQFVIPQLPPEYVLGDVNNDGSVTIADVSVLIDHLLSGDMSATDQFNPLAADMDENGDVSIADVSALIDYLLAGN